MTRAEIGIFLSNIRAEQNITKYRARQNSTLIETQIDDIEQSRKNYTINSLIDYANVFGLELAFIDRAGRLMSYKTPKTFKVIGEPFKHDCAMLMAVQAPSKKSNINCKRCFFSETCDASYSCMGYDREDGTDVIFVKSE